MYVTGAQHARARQRGNRRQNIRFIGSLETLGILSSAAARDLRRNHSRMSTILVFISDFHRLRPAMELFAAFRLVHPRAAWRAGPTPRRSRAAGRGCARAGSAASSLASTVLDGRPRAFTAAAEAKRARLRR